MVGLSYHYDTSALEQQLADLRKRRGRAEIRKVVYLTRTHAMPLATQSLRSGLSQSELVRQWIEAAAQEDMAGAGAPTA